MLDEDKEHEKQHKRAHELSERLIKATVEFVKEKGDVSMSASFYGSAMASLALQDMYRRTTEGVTPEVVMRMMGSAAHCSQELLLILIPNSDTLLAHQTKVTEETPDTNVAHGGEA